MLTSSATAFPPLSVRGPDLQQEAALCSLGTCTINSTDSTSYQWVQASRVASATASHSLSLQPGSSIARMSAQEQATAGGLKADPGRGLNAAALRQKGSSLSMQRHGQAQAAVHHKPKKGGGDAKYA